MKRVKCPSCRGTGIVKYDNGSYDEDRNCRFCAGLGFFYERIIREGKQKYLYRFIGECWALTN